MPSKFWGGKAKNTAPYPDIPSRSSSRLDEYSQRYQPEGDYSEQYQRGSEQPYYPESSHPHYPVGGPKISLSVPQEPSNPPSYDTSPTSQTPSHKDHQEPRRTFRQKLGFTSSSREDVSESNLESGAKGVFKRKTSVRRKEAPSARPHDPDSVPPPPEHTWAYESPEAISRQEQNDAYHSESYQASAGVHGGRFEELQQHPGPYIHSSQRQAPYQPYRTAAEESPAPHPPTHSSSWPVQRTESEVTDSPAARQQQPHSATTSTPASGLSLGDPRAEVAKRISLLRQQALSDQEISTQPGTVDHKTQAAEFANRLKFPISPAREATMQGGPRRGSADLVNNPPPPPQHGNSTLSTPQNPQVDNGRRTPPPSRQASDMTEQDVNRLVADYRELREKYSKVKRYYFEKEEQVKNLQNTLAHQRLSQSRTSLDDGEYSARLTRLDGLISQLAFGFRKDWKIIPVWLHTAVNKDAITIGKQEMTAVGRAFISHWLLVEVFDKYYHPALRLDLSTSLKDIQRNMRRSATIFQPGSDEEDLLTSKIVGWRLATNDGLQPLFASSDAASCRQQLIASLNQCLVSDLQEHMVSPPPAGLEGGVNMIIELAVGILGNLPFESRDVQIEYYMPGQPLLGEVMKVETGIPQLITPIAIPADKLAEVEKSNAGDGSGPDAGQTHHDEPEKDQEPAKKGFLGSLIGGRKASVAQPSGLPRNASASASSTSLGTQQTSAGTKEETNPRVRLCVSLGLQVRGKNVLAKAPVYCT